MNFVNKGNGNINKGTGSIHKGKGNGRDQSSLRDDNIGSKSKHGDKNGDKDKAVDNGKIILGRYGDDTITGNDKDNVLLGFSGNDLYLGNGGDDIFVLNYDHDGVVTVDGGEGIDIIYARTNYSGLELKMEIENGVTSISVNDSFYRVIDSQYIISNIEIVRFYDYDLVWENNGWVAYEQPENNDWIAYERPIRIPRDKIEKLKDEHGKSDDHSNKNPNDKLSDHGKGNEGRDLIFGNKSDDILKGGDNHDTIRGGPGKDFINGNKDNDDVDGEGGDDYLLGGKDNDTVHGGNDDDHVNGNNGNDMVYGDDGDDKVHGGKADDHVFGGKGNDDLFGDLGNDVLNGGDGADSFIFNTNSGVDVIEDFITGVDKIKISSNVIKSAAQAVAKFSDGVIDLGEGNSITLSGVDSLVESDFVII